ncbi:ASKHA domain-containing protein [Anaerocolumna sp. MB42-C2]|uniref:ASKHA domain-containing protein n=1 Tax=Anaerocolumna sp. MB42-C2 TaxID=3070997 RepID=UPI0027DF4342|nr:ASKHA domain-containing protein [Anaerocolumna sp. MB42-C2]WMJ88124.1 ASKHA domain-containing protein [Anaerocolumna sp. MB42-C2]
MEDILFKKEFHIEIEPKNVLQLIQCYEDNPIYEEVLEEYERLKPFVLNRIRPKAVICFTEVKEDYAMVLPKESPVLYSIATVGEEIGELTSQYFAEDEYLKAMLVDAIADTCLFGMEEELKTWIKEECRKRKFGVSHRYEAPVNIPMEAQQIAYMETNAAKNLGISITSAYMFDPVKTNCQVYALTKNEHMFRLDHDCRECDNVNCNVRNVLPVIVTAVTDKGEQEIECKEKETLLEAMIHSGIYLSAVCGGNGTCGKCRVKLLDGELNITLADEAYFSNEELKSGWRLTCQAYPKDACKVLVIQKDESDFEVLSGFKENTEKNVYKYEEDYSIAIDIGTTTIAISLIGNRGIHLIDTYTAVNLQRAYGADVISRMQASINGKRSELRLSICKDLLTGIKQLLNRNHLDKNKISEIAIAGNTTMGHLLLGYDCSNLGIYPFTPVDIGLIRRSFCEVFGDSYGMNCNVTLLPGISTYIGADIVSGFYFCGFHETDRINLLIDLGTNGEMGIGNREKILATSTAAGPAFEGGNITWGTGSIQGAVCNVDLTANQVRIRTIGDKEPIGICGTGVIEAAAELRKAKIIDETGLMAEDYFEEGFLLAKTPAGESIMFTQKDIRELQLAKSAIRAGVETLILRYGVNYDQIDKVYLAGGFGFKMDHEKAIAIGLLPEEFRGKIEAVGNSSLGGAAKYLTEENSKDALLHIVKISSEINLANDIAFNDLYMKHMFFGEDE